MAKSYAMTSVIIECTGNEHWIFKSTIGSDKVKVLFPPNVKELELTREELDDILGELEGLREKMYG